MWSDEVRRARLRVGWTLAEMAAEIGVSARTIIRWEQGDCVPDLAHLQAVANVTGSELRLAFKPRRALDPARRCPCGRIVPPSRRRYCCERCARAES